jgi:hypothetical protein
MAGLCWRAECREEPVADGIFKLIVGMAVDDEVSVDDVQEEFEHLICGPKCRNSCGGCPDTASGRRSHVQVSLCVDQTLYFEERVNPVSVFGLLLLLWSLGISFLRGLT